MSRCSAVLHGATRAIELLKVHAPEWRARLVPLIADLAMSACTQYLPYDVPQEEEQ